jgi:hypothetical protein
VDAISRTAKDQAAHPSPRRCRSRAQTRRLSRTYDLAPQSPVPPQADSPSVELLRAIGALQELNDGEPLPAEELDTLALESGISVFAIWPQIEHGVTAGYIDVGEDNDVRRFTPWEKRCRGQREEDELRCASECIAEKRVCI